MNNSLTDRAKMFDAVPNFIIKHFSSEMKRKLVDAAIAAIRPSIEMAAEDAIRELEPRITAALDRFTDYEVDRLVVDIRLNGEKVNEGT